LLHYTVRPSIRPIGISRRKGGSTHTEGVAAPAGMSRGPSDTMYGMQEPSEAKPENPSPPDEAWRRFTLLDLLIVFSGHEAALGFLKWFGLLDNLDLGAPHIVNRAAFLLLLTIMVGAIISLPLVLFVQFFSRDRYIDISNGELHAIGNAGYWIILFLAFLLIYEFPLALLFLLPMVGIGSVLMFVFCCYGGFQFVAGFFPRKNHPPCYWLSQYGYFLSFVYAVIFPYFVLAYVAGP
jgi:hypothetical protein